MGRSTCSINLLTWAIVDSCSNLSITRLSRSLYEHVSTFNGADVVGIDKVTTALETTAAKSEAVTSAVSGDVVNQVWSTGGWRGKGDKGCGLVER